jgi:hypothetical protein
MGVAKALYITPMYKVIQTFLVSFWSVLEISLLLVNSTMLPYVSATLTDECDCSARDHMHFDSGGGGVAAKKTHKAKKVVGEQGCWR